MSESMKNPNPYYQHVLTLSLFVLVCIIPRAQALIISEVMYNPIDESLEFIEFYNHRAVTEDMSGYTFTRGIQYTFARGTLLGPKQYLVVALDPNALEAAYGISGVYGPYTGRLSNRGERVELATSSGKVLLSLRYNDNHPWPVSPDGTGHSLILKRHGADPQEGTTWAASSLIGGTPGEPDAVQVEPEDPASVTLIDLGHPGRYFKGTTEPTPGNNGEATTEWTEIDFKDGRTPWRGGPSGYGYSNDAGELQYIQTVLDDMSGNYISIYVRLPFTVSAEQLNDFTQLRAVVHYDDDYVLYLNGTRVADSGGLSGSPPAFNQGRGSGTDPGADNVDLSGHLDLLVTGTNVLAIQVHNASIDGSSDCIASPLLYAIAGAPTTSANPNARLVINEVLANSDVGTGTDWIELYNPGPVTVSLDNMYLSDSADELLKYRIPDGIQLNPGEFWAVTQGIAPDGFPFALKSSGETVYVTAASTGSVPIPLRVLDTLRFGNTPPDGPFGRYPDGAGKLALLGSTTLAGPNAKPTMHDIVINEIMYHHGLRDPNYEYVELYNRGMQTVSLEGWGFTDGIGYAFPTDVELAPEGYLVVAKDPNLLASLYDNLIPGVNMWGPYEGGLDDHSERIRLSYPSAEVDPDTGETKVRMISADEVTYYDGGRWPHWADGRGCSLELCDPHSDNDTGAAWAPSDESGKSTWTSFSYTIQSNDPIRYTRDQVNVFDMMLLNEGEILLDDIQLRIANTNRLSNGGFENGANSWRILGNHVQSFVTSEDARSGIHALHLIASGHGDPGANRINQSINVSTNNVTVTFQGWAKWLRGSPYLLMRTTRERSPQQPPRPSHAFELHMPLNQGSPGERNTCYIQNRGPDILEVRHEPVMPSAGQAITVTARVLDVDGVDSVHLRYRTEGEGSFTNEPMADDGNGADLIAGDGLYTATIPGAGGGSMRAFTIHASDGSAFSRFPTELGSTAEVPERTCLVRVGDGLVSGGFASYRIWMSDDVVDTFRSRPNLSNQLLDCTFVYNDSEVFYNARIRHRGSPFLRNGFGQSPQPGHRDGFRIDFNPDQRFGDREEINIDGMEGRGYLQERASYWFHRKMGLQYSDQEYVDVVMNGRTGFYEDVQKIDGDYIRAWFPNDANGYLHKIDDYFEYGADGTGFRNLDEGLKYDNNHPLIPETYRWGFEKRSHREDDNWEHLFDFAVAINSSSNSPNYEATVEAMVNPEHLTRMLALRHAVGDWDSYGRRRGKNNFFYYASQEQKWYLLPWDIDFTLGTGDSPTQPLFSVDSGKFPEMRTFLNYPNYGDMYLQAFSELISGPWRTSYGTGNPPTEFDRFMDDAARALLAAGKGDGRRDGIKQYVLSRRNYIATQAPPIPFEITSHAGSVITTDESITLSGSAPPEVVGIAANDTALQPTFPGSFTFEVEVPLQEGINFLNIQGLDSSGSPVAGAGDNILVVRLKTCSVTSVQPNPVSNDGPVQLTIQGKGFDPQYPHAVALIKGATTIEASEVAVVDEQTITCQVDLTGAQTGFWTVRITPPASITAECEAENALEVVD